MGPAVSLSLEESSLNRKKNNCIKQLTPSCIISDSGGEIRTPDQQMKNAFQAHPELIRLTQKF